MRHINQPLRGHAAIVKPLAAQPAFEQLVVYDWFDRLWRSDDADQFQWAAAANLKVGVREQADVACGSNASL
jgi:hypothetical protein